LSPILPQKPWGSDAPSESPNLLRHRFRSWVPYALGTLIGLWAWPWIRLPFHNPDDVRGYMAWVKYSPLNDSVRFFVLMALPLALLWLDRGSLPKKALPHPPAQAVGHWKSIAILVLFAALIATNLPTYHASGPLDTFHEGETLGTAASWDWNHVPYRDLVFVHGILEDPLQGVLAFRLFGRSIGAVRTLKSIGKVFTWILGALVLYRLFRNDLDGALGGLVLWTVLHQASLYLLLVSPFAGPPGSPASIAVHQATLPILQPFGCILLTRRDFSTFLFILGALPLFQPQTRGGLGRRLSMVLTGFLPWFGLVDTVDRGVFLLATSAVLGLLAWASNRGTDYVRGDVLAYGAGFLGGAAFLGAFLHFDYADFFRYIFAQIPAWKDLWDGFPYRIEEPRFFLSACLITALAYGLLRDILRTGGLERPERLRRYLSYWGAPGLLILLSTLYFRGALGRSDAEHLAYVAWLPVTAAYLWIGGPVGRPGRFLVRALAVALAVACLVGWFRLPLAYLNFPKNVPDESFLSPSEKAARDFLVGQGAPQQGFFTFTSEGIWYYLIDHPCPTPFPITFTLFAKPLQEESVLDLEARKPKWLLYRNGNWSGKVDGISNEDRLPVLASYLRGRYSPVTVIGDQEIWGRK